MSRLWIDIERIVLDGVALDPAKANRLAALTQIALERLLRERGTAAGPRGGAPGQRGGATAQARESRAGQATATRSSPAAEERWADELAQTIYRAVDRSL
jgi:hypothetical protein